MVKRMLSFSPGNEKGITAGVIYVFILLSLGAYLNYAMPYDGEPVESLQLVQIVVWGLLCLYGLLRPIGALSDLAF